MIESTRQLYVVESRVPIGKWNFNMAGTACVCIRHVACLNTIREGKRVVVGWSVKPRIAEVERSRTYSTLRITIWAHFAPDRFKRLVSISRKLTGRCKLRREEGLGKKCKGIGYGLCVVAFVRDPSQHSPGVISRRPDRESNPGSPVCKSSELPLRHSDSSDTPFHRFARTDPGEIVSKVWDFVAHLTRMKFGVKLTWRHTAGTVRIGPTCSRPPPPLVQAITLCEKRVHLQGHAPHYRFTAALPKNLPTAPSRSERVFGGLHCLQLCTLDPLPLNQPRMSFLLAGELSGPSTPPSLSIHHHNKNLLSNSNPFPYTSPECIFCWLEDCPFQGMPSHPPPFTTNPEPEFSETIAASARNGALREVGLTIHPDKVTWAKTYVRYLGFVISNGELVVDPEKI
ncbi:hypothetical protein PR048_000570 [Dryococelus australis]|uniref:Uncharacterized protein n=1 Tax=Dryococelus australis TaxID=614101 RepID=A0ABQ9IF05_9NEOP|nr:hypothetical protein PR048_000570 [Dryococelus australis]